MSYNEPNQNAGLPFGFRDAIRALIKDAKKVLGLPVVAGLAVLAISLAQPKTYTSVTVLNSMNSTADPKSASFANVTSAEVLLHTARILDPVASQFKIPGMTAADRRAALDRKMSLVKARNEPAVTLYVTADSAESALGVPNSIVDGWLPLLKPVGSDRNKLEEKIKIAEAEMKVLQSRIKTLEQDAINKDTAIALVTLYTQERDLNREIPSLKSALAGQGREDVLLSGPILTDEGQNRYLFYVALAAAATLLIAAGRSIWLARERH